MKELNSTASAPPKKKADKKKYAEAVTMTEEEYQKLMAYINHEDPKAFVTVYNVSDMRYQPKL